MLVKDFFLHSARRRIGILVAIIFSLVVTGCGAANPKNCEPNETGGGCTIKSGGYDDYMIGMSKEAALEVSCLWMSQGKLEEHPVFYTNGERRGFYKVSICNLATEALAADEWSLVQPGFRDRSITLEFERSSLEKITLVWWGMDP